MTKNELLNLDLNAACYDGDLKEVKSLVKQGCDVHWEQEEPLTTACENGHLEIVKYLVDNCGVDVQARDNHASRWAAINGHQQVVKYLVECGVDAFMTRDWLVSYGFDKNNKVLNYLESVVLKYKRLKQLAKV